MKKILIACNGGFFPEAAFKMIAGMNEVEPVLLTGVFLSSIDVASLPLAAAGVEGMTAYNMLVGEDDEGIKTAIQHFEKLCQANGIEYRVHRDTDKNCVFELEKETRFADLLFLSEDRFYANQGFSQPNAILEESLHRAECPVVLIPETAKAVEQLILTYDGSAESMFAIRQLAILMPGLCRLPATMVYIDENGGPVPDEPLLTEYLARHFPGLTIESLDFDPRKYFSTWLSEKKNSMVVAGAYGRGLVSNIMKKSFIASVIEEHQVPLFVAHR